MKLWVGLALTLAALVTPAVERGGVVAVQRGRGLDERALKLPLLRGGEPCPVSPGTIGTVPAQSHIFGGDPWYGRGPVYFNWTSAHSPGTDSARFMFAGPPIENGLHRAKTPWVASPSYAGPILIRAQSLDARRIPVRFDNLAERREMNAPNQPAPLWSFWASSLYIPGPGCYGVQIDTSAGTDVVIFEIV